LGRNAKEEWARIKTICRESETLTWIGPTARLRCFTRITLKIIRKIKTINNYLINLLFKNLRMPNTLWLIFRLHSQSFEIIKCWLLRRSKSSKI
jgi:hypothetical protein